MKARAIAILGFALLSATIPAHAQVPGFSIAVGPSGGVATAVNPVISSAKATAPASIYSLPALTPIPYTPFPMIDPSTGKPAQPRDQLTFPNNGNEDAVAYYDQLNMAERILNAEGYSLRTLPDQLSKAGPYLDPEALSSQDQDLKQTYPTLTPAQIQQAQYAEATSAAVRAVFRQTVLSGLEPYEQLPENEPSNLDPSEMLIAARAIDGVQAGGGPFGPAAPFASGSAYGPAPLTGAIGLLLLRNTNYLLVPRGPGPLPITIIPGKAPPSASPPLAPIDYSKSMDFGLGDHDSAGLTLSGKFELTGGDSDRHLKATATLTGSLFGHTDTLLQVEADVSSQASNPSDAWAVLAGTEGINPGEVSGGLKVSVLGKTVYNLAAPANASQIAVPFSMAVPFDDHVETRFELLGFISLEVEAGISGTVGVNAEIVADTTDRPFKVVSISPYIHASLYGTAQVDLGIAGASLSIDSSFLNDAMDLQFVYTPPYWVAQSGQKSRVLQGDCLSGVFENDLSGLDGTIGLNQWITIPGKGVSPWTRDEMDQTLFDWPGFNGAGVQWSDTMN